MTSHGQFVWYELMTTDPKAAVAFYGAVAGWKSADAGVPDMAYTLLKVAERPVAGAMMLPPDAKAAGARPSWVGYVAVENIDGAAARVKQAGGKLYVEPSDIPNVGRFAVAADPQGATFAMIKGMSDQPPPLPPATPGAVSWHELHADDWKSAFDFYSGLFGWTKKEAMEMGPAGTYQLFATGAEAVGGMMNKEPQSPIPYWLYYINVAEIKAAIARVKDNGGQVIFGPQQVPGGSWIVNCFDPQGAMFALVGPQT